MNGKLQFKRSYVAQRLEFSKQMRTDVRNSKFNIFLQKDCVNKIDSFPGMIT